MPIRCDKIISLVNNWDSLKAGEILCSSACDDLTRIDWLLSQIGNSEELKSLISQGYKSRIGSGSGRQDALAVLTKNTVDHLLEEAGEWPMTDKVIQELWRFDDSDSFHATIQGISGDDKEIYWVDYRGREKTTTFDAFDKRLYRLRTECVIVHTDLV